MSASELEKIIIDIIENQRKIIDLKKSYYELSQRKKKDEKNYLIGCIIGIIIGRIICYFLSILLEIV